MYKPWKGHLEGEQPQLGDLLTMLNSHILTGMILQVENLYGSIPPLETIDEIILLHWASFDSIFEYVWTQKQTSNHVKEALFGMMLVVI